MSLIHVQKQNNIRYFIILSLLTLFFAGIFSSVKAADTDVSKETKEALNAIGEYSVEQKDAAVEKAKEMMDSLDARINKLEEDVEAKWDDLKESSKEKYHTSLIALRKQRNEVSEWYGSMKHSSKSAWNEVKAGFAKSYDNLVESWQDTEKEIDEDK